MAKVFSSFDQGAKFRQIWSYCSALPFIVVKYFPAKRSRRKVKKNFFSVINYKNKTFIWASFSSFYIGQIRPLFVYFALFKMQQQNMTYNWTSIIKKCWCRSWDSNQEAQDERRVDAHESTMVFAHLSLFSLPIGTDSCSIPHRCPITYALE